LRAYGYQIKNLKGKSPLVVGDYTRAHKDGNDIEIFNKEKLEILLKGNCCLHHFSKIFQKKNSLYI
jgi:hypothetical protein